MLLQLSGGLDSSSIVCAADWILQEGGSDLCPVAVAALHPGLACDEEPFIRAVSEQIRFPTETWDGTLTDVDELVDVPVAAPEVGIR